MKVTSLSEFDISKVPFSKLENKGNDSMSFERINIEYLNGEVGPLILETDKCFSFGVQSNRDRFENGSGYTLPIVMYNKTSKRKLNPTEHQREFMETFNKIVEKCKAHLKSLGREFPENIAKCMYTKETSSSTLYVKLSNRYMTDEITTPFYKMNEDEEVNPKKYLNKKCFVKAAVRFNNIYIGNTTSLQIKLE